MDVWKLCVQRKDCSASWNPDQVTKYTAAQGIEHDMEFKFWVKDVMKKRSRIISLVKGFSANYFKRIHKFGI